MLGLLTLTFWLTLGGRIDADEQLQVGVLVPFEGPYPWLAPKVVPALQIAVDTITAKTSLLPGHKLVLVVRNSNCSSTAGPLAAVDLYSHAKTRVFLGPVCDYSLSPVARFSPNWGIPVLSPGGLVSAFHDKTEYSLLTRTLGSYSKVAEFFLQMASAFSWKHIGLVYNDHTDPNKGKSQCFFAMEAIYLALKGKQMTPWHLSLDITNLDHTKVFENIKQNARVIVLCLSPDAVRSMMIHAHDNDFDKGDYAFINFELFTCQEKLKTPWYRETDTLDNNNKARKAYEALMTITVRNPRNDQYRAFSKEVKRRSRVTYPDFEFDEAEVNSFVAAFHDSLMLYAMAATEVITDGGNVSDGAEVTRRMWNRTFQGISGTVAIDSNGDRDMDFFLMDMNPSTGNFEVVATYYGMMKKYEPVLGKIIHWAGGRTSHPSDVPDCGFDGAKCKTLPTYGVVIIVFGCVLLLVLVGLLLIYRWKFSNYLAMSRRESS